jgi:hypothetical protein
MKTIHHLSRLFTIAFATLFLSPLGLTAQAATEPQAQAASQSTFADPDKVPATATGKVWQRHGSPWRPFSLEIPRDM